jgi:hypothetical protein
MQHTWYRIRPGAPKHRYEVTVPQAYVVPELTRDVEIYGTTSGHPLLARSSSRILSIRKGYTFDGATCAPDAPSLMPAFLVHDLLCQLCEIPGWPISRFQADRIFYREARKLAPFLAAVYYTGIRFGGGLHRALVPPTAEDGIMFIHA